MLVTKRTCFSVVAMVAIVNGDRQATDELPWRRRAVRAPDAFIKRKPNATKQYPGRSFEYTADRHARAHRVALINYPP